MDVDMISFTGSTKVAKLVQMMAGKSNMKRVTLETVSKSPFVIFDDADIDWSAMTSHLSVFMSAGTACCTSTKIYVHEAIYDKFVHKCADLCKNRVLGDPFDNRTEQGPQIDEHHFNEVIQYIELGRKEGAKVLTGGKRWGNKGWYIEPTVMCDVTDNMQIAKEELTGPVMTIMKFRTIDEVIDRINDSYYGLDAGVFTRDTDKAMYFAQAVHTGNVWINHYISITPQIPFGGYKQSGVGREAGKDGLYEFTEVKSIVLKVDQKLS
jgi:acyl-CoA reductase-like NAD-dependent aldehyde dehydrogenase